MTAPLVCQALLHRAWRDGVRLTPIPARPGYFIAHGKTGSYVLSARGCGCPAARLGPHKPVCKHLVLLGFERPDLEIPALAAPKEVTLGVA
jgi:hypothetical protein